MQFKGDKKYFIIGLIIILAAIVCLAVFFALKRDKKPEEKKLEPIIEKSEELKKAEEQLREIEDLRAKSDHPGVYTAEEIKKQQKELNMLREEAR
jgi:hypothetical protein